MFAHEHLQDGFFTSQMIQADSAEKQMWLYFQINAVYIGINHTP